MPSTKCQTNSKCQAANAKQTETVATLLSECHSEESRWIPDTSGQAGRRRIWPRPGEDFRMSASVLALPGQILRAPMDRGPQDDMLWAGLLSMGATVSTNAKSQATNARQSPRTNRHTPGLLRTSLLWCLVFGACLEFGVWSLVLVWNLVFGPWCLSGIWCLVLGACLEFGAWFLVLVWGLVFGPWCLCRVWCLPGVWCLWRSRCCRKDTREAPVTSRVGTTPTHTTSTSQSSEVQLTSPHNLDVDRFQALRAFLEFVLDLGALGK